MKKRSVSIRLFLVFPLICGILLALFTGCGETQKSAEAHKGRSPETEHETESPETGAEDAKKDGTAEETEENLPAAAIVNEEKKLIDVTLIRQGDRFPNGCEIISATMLLRHFRYYTVPEDFIDLFLDKGPAPYDNWYGPDPDSVYCGDPYSVRGWGCNSPVIYKALDRIFSPDRYTVTQSRGTPLSELCEKYIDSDIPVLVWATVEMKDNYPDATWWTYEGKMITYNTGLHCLLLVGYDDENYYFNDPLCPEDNVTDYIGYPKDAVERCYELIGSQSVAVVPVE